MATFKISYEKTAKFEGGYSNHETDHGGETYKGIARNIHPSWSGWKVIDRYKESAHSARQINAVLSGNVQLNEMVERFYLENFWNPIIGTSISNQLMADNIYDFAVNSGVSRAVKYAQRIVGTVEDGIMGAKTIKALNKNVHDFVYKYKAARLGFLKKIVANDHTQNVFIDGWTNRVQNV